MTTTPDPAEVDLGELTMAEYRKARRASTEEVADPTQSPTPTSDDPDVLASLSMEAYRTARRDQR